MIRSIFSGPRAGVPFAAAPPGGGEPGHDPLLDQRPLVLGERAKDVEQELAVRRRGVHLLGQRAERDTLGLEVLDDADQVRKGPAEAVELPHHQDVAGVQELQAGFQPWPIIARARGLVLVKVPLVDAGGDQRIVLQIDRLAFVGGCHFER
jgi:hypothetical protein